MHLLISMLASAVLAVGAVAFITPLFPAPVVEPTEQLGAALPSATAVFETSLAAPISSSATSMTLTANVVRGGGAVSGYTCFTVDEGSAQAETICGTVSGTAVSSLTRGVSQATGTSTDTDLQFAHRRGANVKITDFPIIQILKAQNSGEDTFANPLSYATASSTIVNPEHIATKAYVDYTAFNGAGVIDASATARGVVELASQAEAAASTAAGSSGNLALPASISTSTWNSATAASRVVVTGVGGTIDNNFLSTSTLFATSSIQNTAISGLGKNVQVFTSTGTTTFSVPTNVTRVKVTTIGAGGGGGSAESGGSNDSGAGGGGGGSCAIEWLDLTGTSTVQVFVGSGGAGGSSSAGSTGTWSTFGTNGFYNSAAGGTGGGIDTAPNGGAGGAASGGTINFAGGGGGGGHVLAAAPTGSAGAGGSSCMGGGAAGASSAAGGAGASGGNYGGGGSGATSSGAANAGGAGANGLVIVEW